MKSAAFCLLAAALISAPLVHSQTPAAPATRAPKGSGEDIETGLPADIHRLAIGDSAPDFKLPGIDGRTYTLADFKDAPVLMVVFLSNHCPYSHAAETRLLPLVKEMKSRGLAVVAINPNSPDAVAISELGYSKYNDSFEEMKPYAAEAGFTFPYLYDGDTQATAKAYGALATPHVFLFDRNRKLQYAGRFDDNRLPGPEGVKSPDTRNALEAMFAGKPVPVAMTRPMGCSTKWISKKEKVAEGEEQWTHEPVTLENIDASGVAALAANKSDKLRLINVWATWCAPCVEEFPGLVKLTRQLGNRDFEVVTISMDDAKQQARALKFLQDRHAAAPGRLKRSLQREGRSTNNYLYTGGTDDFTAALDKEWPGPLPHTILVAPGGKIVYRHNGPLDFDQLRDRIFAELGHYYK
jgi:peroxiredoxin